MTTNRVPGYCKHEKCIMRTVSGRYLYSICDFEGKDNKVQCRKYGFCIDMLLDEIYRITSIDKMKSYDSLCRQYILSNDKGDAILVEHTTSGLDNPFKAHPSTCRAYNLDLDANYIDRDECLASADNMHVDVAFDEILRQLAINFDRCDYNYRALCGFGDRDGI